MANHDFTVTTAELDQFNSLNRALHTYQDLVTSWVSKAASEGAPVDISGFIAGLDLIFEPILGGYRDLEAKIYSLRVPAGESDV